jgi:hypothetical protein
MLLQFDTRTAHSCSQHTAHSSSQHTAQSHEQHTTHSHIKKTIGDCFTGNQGILLLLLVEDSRKDWIRVGAVVVPTSYALDRSTYKIVDR